MHAMPPCLRFIELDVDRYMVACTDEIARLSGKTEEVNAERERLNVEMGLPKDSDVSR